jgi:hypothetical protein
VAWSGVVPMLMMRGMAPGMILRLRIPMPHSMVATNAGNLEVATVGMAEFTSADETELMRQCRQAPRIISAIHAVVSGLTDIDRHPHWM